MKFGITKEHYDYIYNNVILPLKAKGAEVYCYGSRARGDHQPFSDLDLMVESESKNNLKLEDIIELLQKSNFPYKVDLVHISDFADSYKKSYQADRVLFDIKDC